jgi:hypothetical protein
MASPRTSNQNPAIMPKMEFERYILAIKRIMKINIQMKRMRSITIHGIVIHILKNYHKKKKRGVDGAYIGSSLERDGNMHPQP